MIKIFRPLKTFCITQKFGPKGTIPRMLPIYQKHGLKAHNGWDLCCWYKEPIYHSGNFTGKAKTEVDMAGGIGVDIISLKPHPKTHIKLRYWHLQKAAVYDGQIIKQGDLIGWGDSTGFSTGNHLHFGLKPCDEKGKPLYRNNGYFGAIDPEPYFINSFEAIEKIQNIKKVLRSIKSLLIKIRYEQFCKSSKTYHEPNERNQT